MNLTKVFLERISAGIQRKSIVSVSDWALQYRIMGPPKPGPFSFKWHPWTKEITDCESPFILGRKAAQMGFTEIALNMAFKAIDIDALNVLYVLPTLEPDATDFSSSRFDPALEASPYLKNLFSDVKNVKHKRAGNANLFIRSAKSRSQLKSIPAARLYADEIEEFPDWSIPLMLERLSGQENPQFFGLSTPTVEGHGISKLFKDSTQKHYFFRCPSCSKLTELVFPECLVITSDNYTDSKIKETYLVCKECKQRLDHQAKPDFLKNGQWVPEYKDKIYEGYHINQLYSCLLEPWKIATLYLKSLLNPTDEQEFYNSKLGLPHVVEGAKVTDQEIEECTKNYTQVNRVSPGKLVTMGVDVGKFLHCEIDEWYSTDQTNINDINSQARCTLLKVIKLNNFEELDNLMLKYNVNFCVIDAQPESRKSKEFVMRFPGISKACYYGRALTGKDFTESEYSVRVDRTSWLDLALGRFHNNKIDLPVDLDLEYKSNIKSLVRVHKKNKEGNPVGQYVSTDNDHYGHARTYSEIALFLVASLGRTQTIH